ncbi:MAG: GntR family transcriptional regulator [Chloroflexota bacterium]|nr:GntR family transcriptional regulator [Chloroflexota bacterium]
MMEVSAVSAPRHQTKQEFVYQTLRKAIMRAELAPGERLRTEDIAQRLGVSPIPVREALQLLQSERLVETIPHVGARVARVSHESVIEVFTVMEGLELVATRTAAARMTPSHLETLASLLRMMDQALENANYDEWGDLNTSFHLAIASMTGMSMLQEMTERALNQWDRVRRYYLKGVLTERLSQAQKEHHLIVQAVREQDYPALERLVRAHNQSALSAYMEYLSTAPIHTGA